jgi:hypothetical protein
MSTAWTVLFVLQWAAIVTALVLVLGVLRRLVPTLAAAEDLLTRHGRAGPLEGLHVGEYASGLTEAADAHFRDLLASGPRVLLFLKAGCRPCEALAAELAANPHEPALSQLVVVVPNLPESDQLNLDGVVEVVRQEDDRVARTLGTTITPHAFVVNEAGLVLVNEIAPTLEVVRRIATTIGGNRTERRTQGIPEVVGG